MNEQAWRLSIDFGTTNTAAAVELADGTVRPVRLGARSDAMPSAVAIYRDEVLTGDSAVRIAGIDPSAFEPTPKRRLSEDSIVLGGAVHDPVELVAAVLRRVEAEAAKLVGHDGLSEVILTHPAAWDAYLEDRLLAAAERAGLEPSITVLMPEPVAAAWHYATTSSIPGGARVAVIDFGGGTCDAAVLELEETPEGEVFEVLASDGIDPLGGHDFDDRVFQWTHDQLQADDRVELVERLRHESSTADRSMLRDQVREAKHALSFHASAPIGVRSGDQEAVVTITRDEFDQLVDDDLDRAVSLARSVLSASGTSLENLHQLYLTGGSSSIPALQTKLTTAFGAKLGRMGDPKQVTSLGALQAPDAKFVPEPVVDDVPTDDEPKPQSIDEPPPRRPWAKILSALAGVAVVAVVIVFAVANAGGDGGGGGDGGVGDGGTSADADVTGDTDPPPERTCGGVENDSLSDAECNLLDDFVDDEAEARLDPSSCTSLEPIYGASAALDCTALEGAAYTPQAIAIYSYNSASEVTQAFEDIRTAFGARGPLDAIDSNMPAWSDQADGSFVFMVKKKNQAFVVWDTATADIIAWAQGPVADAGDLYVWWL